MVAMNSIVDDISGVENILVTVSTNPSVDELSAALELSTYGQAREALYCCCTVVARLLLFILDPKSVEDTADSLRDFIIALDKDKADHRALQGRWRRGEDIYNTV